MSPPGASSRGCVGIDEALRETAEPGVGEAPEWALVVFFKENNAEVRGQAAKCSRQLNNDVFDTSGDLIAAFCDSRAFHEGASWWLLRTLEESLGRLPGTTCLVCEKFLDRFAGEARDIRTRGVGDAFTVAKLVFRTYRQHQNDEWTCRTLNLIDHLCLEGIGGAGSHLDQFER